MSKKIASKEFLLQEGLREIKSFSTRHKRAADDQQLLINDLERIEQITQRCMNILASDKQEYNTLEHEMIHLKEFHEGIDEIVQKKNKANEAFR